MRFPYQRYEVNPSPTVPSGVLYRPELPVRVIGQTGSVLLLASADTGSDDTLLPHSVGEAIGALIDGSAAWRVGGVGGQEIDVRLGEVDLDLELARRGRVQRWRAKVGFVAFTRPEDEVAILGHCGFFDHFAAHFNSRRRIMTITPYR
jgi:hypothetical protein